jgi:hypothetical protein
MSQRGFADAGNIFYQQMAASQQTAKRKPNLPGFAENDLIG